MTDEQWAAHMRERMATLAHQSEIAFWIIIAIAFIMFIAMLWIIVDCELTLRGK